MLETTVNILGGISIGLILGSLGMLYCNRWHEKRYKKLGWKLETATWKLKDYQELDQIVTVKKNEVSSISVELEYASEEGKARLRMHIRVRR